MPDRVHRHFLNDMLDAVRAAREFVAGVDFDAFRRNREKQFAVIRAIEVLGEAAKNVPAPVRARHPALPWSRLRLQVRPGLHRGAAETLAGGVLRSAPAIGSLEQLTYAYEKPRQLVPDGVPKHPIAVGPGLTARERAEDEQLAHTVAAQRFTAGCQRTLDVFEARDHAIPLLELYNRDELRSTHRGRRARAPLGRNQTPSLGHAHQGAERTA